MSRGHLVQPDSEAVARVVAHDRLVGQLCEPDSVRRRGESMFAREDDDDLFLAITAMAAEPRAPLGPTARSASLFSIVSARASALASSVSEIRTPGCRRIQVAKDRRQYDSSHALRAGDPQLTCTPLRRRAADVDHSFGRGQRYAGVGGDRAAGGQWGARPGGGARRAESPTRVRCWLADGTAPAATCATALPPR